MTNYVYMTRRNQDMTEGRGPMVNDRCFSTLELANQYIDDKPGVMGRRAKWSTEKYGDWDVNRILVHSSIQSEDEILREKALAKLTPEEKKILGLK